MCVVVDLAFCILLQINHHLSIPSTVDRYLGSFQFYAITKSTTVNLLVHARW